MKKLMVIMMVMTGSVLLSAGNGKKIILKKSPLQKRLDTIMIDNVEFEDEKPLTVFKTLRKKSKELDPDGKGVNFILKDLDKSKKLVTLILSDASLAYVIKSVCLSADLDYTVDEYAVIIQPKKKK